MISFSLLINSKNICLLFHYSFFSANKCFESDVVLATFEKYRVQCCSMQEATFSTALSPLENPASWNQQLSFISSIPNSHKWQNKTVSLCQYLSIPDPTGKYKLTSIRNQILYYFREGILDMVYAVCC